MHQNQPNVNINRLSSESELEGRRHLLSLFDECPIPDDEKLRNLGLFLTRQALSRIMFMESLYRRIIDVHGIVVEFGTRWGQNVALFQSLRGMYEPYNINRQIVAFDTFGGFVGTDEKDGNYDQARPGGMGVTQDYEKYLEKVLAASETQSPLAHVRRFELWKGDASETLPKYLEMNPQTIIALAYFDMDVYKPTRDCLALIKDRLTKGSIVGFDELNEKKWPGETEAYREVFPLDRYAIRRSPHSAPAAFIEID